MKLSLITAQYDNVNSFAAEQRFLAEQYLAALEW